MGNNPCQQLEELYRQCSAVNLQDIEWEQMRKKSWKDFKDLRAKIAERFNIFEEYQKQVKNLLREWYNNNEFIESVQFEEDGRVVIAGDLDLQDIPGGVDFVPSLIKKVEGDLSIRGDVEHVDYLLKKWGEI